MAQSGALGLVLLAAACSRGPSPPAGVLLDPARPLPSPLPDVVARVNGQAVALKDILPLAKPRLEKAEDPVAARPRALREALDEYVGRELLFQEAERRSLKPDERVVESAYNQTRLRYPDEKEWHDTLLYQGFDPPSFRKELRIQAALALLGEEEAAQAPPVTDDEAEAYYNAHPDEFRFDKLIGRHIFLRVQEWGTEAQRAQRVRAEDVRMRIRRGQKFADLARELSDDETSRDKGGEMPPFSRGEAPPALEAAAFALKPGEVSEVVETPLGYHIFELVSRVGGGLPPYTQLADRIKQRLFQDRRSESVKRLGERLRAKARIDLYL